MVFLLEQGHYDSFQAYRNLQMSTGQALKFVIVEFVLFSGDGTS